MARLPKFIIPPYSVTAIAHSQNCDIPNHAVKLSMRDGFMFWKI